MNMDYLNTVAAINSLVEINNDRIEGYATASLETDEQELKAIFNQLVNTSSVFNSELIFEIHKLEGTPVEGTSTIGKFFRVWMEVKTAITDRDREAILRSCAYGEEIAMETYNIALSRDLEDLPDDIKVLIQKQRDILKKDGDKINLMLKNLQDADM
jgi:uncharacterized protein (TIGR02284 family)